MSFLTHLTKIGFALKICQTGTVAVVAHSIFRRIGQISIFEPNRMMNIFYTYVPNKYQMRQIYKQSHSLSLFAMHDMKKTTCSGTPLYTKCLFGSYCVYVYQLHQAITLWISIARKAKYFWEGFFCLLWFFGIWNRWMLFSWTWLWCWFSRQSQ